MLLPSIQIAMEDPGLPLRPVVPGGAGGAMAPPHFGRSVNPFSTKGGRLCPPNYTQYGPITNVGIFPLLGVLYLCPDVHC